MSRCSLMLVANNIDPDQTAPKTAPNEQSDQGLSCLLVHYDEIFMVNVVGAQMGR